MNLIENVVTIPMRLDSEYTVDPSGRMLVSFLTGALTTLDDTMVPNSVTSLRNYQFQDFINLTTVNLKYVQNIGNSTFSGCAIENLNLPALISSGMSSFAYNPFTEVTLPMLETVGNQMFRNCRSLQKADFASVVSIDRRAFYWCDNLDTLILRSDSIADLNSDAPFYGTKIESGDGYIYVPSGLVEDYREAPVWTLYASQIRSLDDLDI